MKEKVSVPFMLLGILFNVCLIAANLLETKVIQVGRLITLTLKHITQSGICIRRRNLSIPLSTAYG